MSHTAIAIVPSAGEVAPYLDREKVELLKQTILNGATDLELQMFVNLCNTKRLDPMTRQIYGIKTGAGLQMFASIDGLRVIAQRSGEYGGQVGPFWCGADGEWVDVWLQGEKPAAAKVGVLRTGWLEPMWGVATLKSYGKNSPTWNSMPDVMLAKCAESVALRKAFPDDLSGLYVKEEIAEDEAPARPAQAEESRPRLQSHRVSAEELAIAKEDVNQDTGQIETPESIAADMKEAREALGWTSANVQAEADSEDINLRTMAGLVQMRDHLQSLVTAALQGDETVEPEYAVS